VLAVMDDIINTFDEYVVCFSFATKGIAQQGEELANTPLKGAPYLDRIGCSNKSKDARKNRHGGVY
jgi:hypothetical protein